MSLYSGVERSNFVDEAFLVYAFELAGQLFGTGIDRKETITKEELGKTTKK